MLCGPQYPSAIERFTAVLILTLMKSCLSSLWEFCERWLGSFRQKQHNNGSLGREMGRAL
jgi:hypothetical protein